MKINRNNTAIHFLEEKDPLAFGIAGRPGQDTRGLSIMLARTKDAFPSMRTKCKGGKVQYISDPFEEAYDRAKGRLTLNMEDDVVKQAGVFIFRHKSGGGKNTIFYSLDCRPDPSGYLLKGSIIAFSKMKHEPLPALFSCYFVDKSQQRVKWYCDEQGEKASFELLVDIFYLCLFIRYCEIETKVIKGEKKGECAGSKYLNETKSDVEIVDSTWFTTIIREEGFGVRGHFRLQPYPSLGTKKLIYIAPFRKNGYKREAKKLSNGSEGLGQNDGGRPNQGLQGHDGGQDGDVDTRAEESTTEGAGA